MNYKSFTEPYLNSLGPFGDIIVSMLSTIAAQDLIKISENTKAALAKTKAAGVQLDAPTKGVAIIEQARRLKDAGTSNQGIGWLHWLLAVVRRGSAWAGHEKNCRRNCHTLSRRATGR